MGVIQLLATAVHHCVGVAAKGMPCELDWPWPWPMVVRVCLLSGRVTTRLISLGCHGKPIVLASLCVGLTDVSVVLAA